MFAYNLINKKRKNIYKFFLFNKLKYILLNLIIITIKSLKLYIHNIRNNNFIC